VINPYSILIFSSNYAIAKNNDGLNLETDLEDVMVNGFETFRDPWHRIWYTQLGTYEKPPPLTISEEQNKTL